jgi:hypothetical protein
MTLPFVSKSQSLAHPCLWASAAEKAQITSNIASFPWASSIYIQLKSRVDAKKDAHKLNPETILSTIPSLTGTDRTGQTEMLNTAAESAILYYLTDNTDYAQMAADILSNYTDKLALVDTVNIRKSYFFGDWWLESRTTYPRIPIIYDFVYNFVNNPSNTVYDLTTHARKKFNNTAAQIAVQKLAANDMRSIVAPKCNHSVLAGNGVLLNILMIDNNAIREGFFNRYYKDPSNKLLFDSFTWTLANFSTQNIWPETLSYGKMSQEIVLQALNIIDRIKPELGLISKNMRVLDGCYKYADYYFPSGASVRYGDSHRNIDRITVYQRILAIATRKNLTDYITKAKQVLKYEYGLIGGYKPVVTTETLEWYGPLQLLWGVNVANSVTAVPETIHPTVRIEHAGIVLQRNNNTTDSVNYGLMYTTGGATYVHAHATGIEMELYGNGNVLGVNNGTGDYTPVIHDGYETQYAAGNTVIVNSSAKRGPANSWYDIMKKVTLDASEPAPNDDVVSKDFTFSTQSLNDTYNDCLQQRTVGMIRTSDKSGYYLDVFRSTSNGTNNYHDYLYHNISDTVTLKFSNNVAVSLNPSARYSTDITGSVSGWKYFSNVISSNATTNGVNALFSLNTLNKYMNVFIPSGVSREYSSVVAPPTYEAENNYYKKNTHVMTIRQYGEAWDRPFICAFEPSIGTNPTVKSVEQLMNGTKVVGAKVTSLVNGITITDWVISQEASNLTYTNSADAITFTGRFGIVRTSVQNGKTSVSLYIGDGSSLQYNDSVLVANSKNSGLKSFDLDGTAIKIITRPKLSISPTITSGKITINAGIDEQAKYAIFNMTGICLKKGNAMNNTIVDLSQFPSGTYLAQLMNDSQILSQKLIIRK